MRYTTIILLFISALVNAQTLYEYNTTATNNRTNEIQYGYYEGQTFTVGTNGTNEAHDIYSVKWKLWKSGSPGTVTCELKAVDGDGLPTGSVLSSGTINGNTLTESTDGEVVEILMSSYELQPSTKYAVYLRAAGAAVSAKFNYQGNPYSGGAWIRYNSGWSVGDATSDYYFEVYGTSSGGEPPAETGGQPIAAWFFNNNATDFMGNHNGVLVAGSYDSNYKLEGTHSFLSDGVGEYIKTENKVDLGDTATIVFSFRNTNESGYPAIIASHRSGIGTGFQIFADLANKAIRFRKYNGSDYGDAISATNSWVAGDWVHVAIRTFNTQGQYFKIFINGTASGIDSVAITGAMSVNDTIAIGTLLSGDGSFYGRIDNVQIYDYALSDEQISYLYENRATATIIEDETPPSYEGLLVYRDEVQMFPRRTEIERLFFRMESTYVPPAEQGSIFAINQSLGRGLNAYGVVAMNNTVDLQWSAALFDSIADAGFDHLRLVIYGVEYGAAPAYTISSTSIERLEAIFDSCLVRGIIPLFDYHQPAFLNNATQANKDAFISHW